MPWLSPHLGPWLMLLIIFLLKNYVARTYLGVGYLFVIMSKVINALLRADFGTPTNI